MRDKVKGVLAALLVVAVLAVGGAAIAGATGGGDSSQGSEPPESSEPAGQSDANENESATEQNDATENESATESESAGENEGQADDGSGQPITGSDLDRASAVALQQTGGGTVTDSEVNDEQGYYEVEVTKDDGSQVDVHLDRGFHVINAEADGGE